MRNKTKGCIWKPDAALVRCVRHGRNLMGEILIILNYFELLYR